VLVVSDLFGSHKKGMDNIAVDLSKTKWAMNPDVNMFNVTIFTEKDP